MKAWCRFDFATDSSFAYLATVAGEVKIVLYRHVIDVRRIESWEGVAALYRPMLEALETRGLS